jgi:hypothetical protein
MIQVKVQSPSSRYLQSMKMPHLFLLIFVVALGQNAMAQEEWPRTIVSAEGSTIHIFHPQPDSIFDNNIRFSAAFSITGRFGGEPVYGAFEAFGIFGTDKNNRTLTIAGANLSRLDICVPYDSAAKAALRETIECGLPSIAREISLDRVIAMLEKMPEVHDASPEMDHTPPHIIVSGKPSMLVLIDGVPRFKWNKDYGVKVIANSPNTIIGTGEGWFYLYGGRHWYIAPMAEGPYHLTFESTPDLQRVMTLVDGINGRDAEHPDTLREGHDVIVELISSQQPAELLQTRGASVLVRIAGTHLFYISNSNNDIFLDSLGHRYYTLISGRWFIAHGLAGPWEYVSADSLPHDFARIPEGSAEDRVLACVPGTPAADEAIIEAFIPQTGLVDRHRSTTHITFEGEPKFAPIRGTHLEYAINTPVIVLRAGEVYYAVDQGVWFGARSAGGPWTPCTRRPSEVNAIPPNYPVYNCKYVYIYSADSNYIVTGYTAGYLGSYLDGHTMVYGTGYYTPGFAGNNYIPRPWTYGFNMWYNPWYGWSLGYDCSLDWLNTSMAWGRGYWTGGWWGPAIYRPAYIWHHFAGHGLYEKDIRRIAGSSYNNNLYSLRPDVAGRIETEDVITDGNGQVFRSNGNGDWFRRTGDHWSSVDISAGDTLLRLAAIESRRQRGTMRTMNFLEANGGFAAGLTIASPGQLPP